MSLKNKVTCIRNGRVMRLHTLAEEELWVCGGKIVAPQKTLDVEIDARGLIVAPGYIDLQINGGFGCDLVSQPEKVRELALQLPACGVTAFLPTLISTDQKHYAKALSYLQPQKIPGGASILGVHLEGPFLNPEKKGVHDSHFLKEWNEETRLFYPNHEGVKLVTLAPEIKGGLQLIEFLREKDICVTIGHSAATFDLTNQAIAMGTRAATHLFNGMRSFHHREPGIVGAVLSTKHIFYSLIADGYHVHPQVIDMAWRLHPEGLFLISDAMEGLGAGSGTYQLGTIEVEVSNQKAIQKGTDTLAGSVLSLDAAVRNFRKFTNCLPVQAIEAATLKPAKLLRIEKNKGSLEIGSDADFIFLDDDLNVKSTFIEGQNVFFL